MRSFCFFLLLLAADAASGQAVLDSAMLRYHCTRRSVSRRGDSVVTHTRFNVLFTPQWIREEQSNRPGIWTTIVSDRRNGAATAYVTNGKEFYKMEESTSTRLFSLGGWNEAKLRTELLPDTATIRGRHCRKAMLRGVVASAEDSLELWYVPDTVLHVGKAINLFADVPGLPMRFRFREYPAMVMGQSQEATMEYNLAAVETTGLRPQEIESAGKYEWIDEGEKMQVLMRVLLGKRQ